MSDWWNADPVASAQPADNWWAGDKASGTHTPGEIATDIAKSTGIGLAKGLIGLPGMIGDAKEIVGKGVLKAGDALGLPHPPEGAPEPGNLTPTSHDIQSAVEGVTGKFYKPQTTPGKYFENTASFVPATLAGGGGIARKLVTQAVVPGVASEAAGQATEGTALEPWARGLAAIVGGGAASALTRSGSAKEALRSALPDFVTDSHVTKADQLIQYAQQRGVTLTWPEALSRVTGRPVLLDTQRILESAPQSRTRMDEVLGERPQQVENAARGEMANLGPATQNPSSIGPQVGTAAEGAVNDVRQGINRAAEPFYDRSKYVLLTPEEMANVRGIPGYHEAAAAVRADPHLNRYVGQLPEESVGFLNEVKKHLDQQATNATAPLAQNPSMQRAASMRQSAGDVRDIASRTPHSQDYSTALMIEEHGRRKFLEPLLQGPLGKLAEKDIATKKAIDTLFPSSPLPNSQAEISTAVGAVAKRNPTAASQLVRAHVESVFNDATQSLQGGPSQWGGAKFAAVLVGNPQQRANLKAAVEALPNGQQRWSGFERFLDVMEATGKRQAIGSKTAFNELELKSLSSSSFPLEATKIGLSPSKWLSVVNDKWSKWQLGRNLDQLAEVLTSPRSAKLLGQISAMPAGSREAAVTAARIVANAVGTVSRDRDPIEVRPHR